MAAWVLPAVIGQTKKSLKLHCMEQWISFNQEKTDSNQVKHLIEETHIFEKNFEI